VGHTTAAASGRRRTDTQCASPSQNAEHYENPHRDRLSADADVRPEIDWRHFVAYAVFFAATFVWVQARRGRGRAVTALGMAGFVAAFWLMLVWR
jgi:hypothetical protein